MGYNFLALLSNTLQPILIFNAYLAVHTFFEVIKQNAYFRGEDPTKHEDIHMVLLMYHPYPLENGWSLQKHL